MENALENNCLRALNFTQTETQTEKQNEESSNTETGFENKTAELLQSDITPQVVKVKRDFYQTESDIVVNVLAKNLKQHEVKLEYSENTLSVEAKLSDGADYKEVIPLFGSINPHFCSYKVLSSKIEVRLRKVDSSTWKSLEPQETELCDLKPSYPTSSKTKKDWEKVEKEVEKEMAANDDTDNVFAKLFASTSEESQRAMMKSMQESGGTVLNMNWDEVGKKKIEVSPPDGMEWKKWDSSTKK